MSASLCLLFSGSCAAPAAKSVKTGGSSDADRLYAELDAAVARYRDGLHKLLEDESRDEGRSLMTQAASEIATGGDACVRARGCEPQRFMSAYANLLSLRSEALAGGRAEAFSEVEPLERDFTSLQDMPQVARSIGMLNGVQLDQVIKVNGPIKAALQDWLTTTSTCAT